MRADCMYFLIIQTKTRHIGNFTVGDKKCVAKKWRNSNTGTPSICTSYAIVIYVRYPVSNGTGTQECIAPCMPNTLKCTSIFVLSRLKISITVNNTSCFFGNRKAEHHMLVRVLVHVTRAVLSIRLDPVDAVS